MAASQLLKRNQRAVFKTLQSYAFAVTVTRDATPTTPAQTFTVQAYPYGAAGGVKTINMQGSVNVDDGNLHYMIVDHDAEVTEGDLVSLYGTYWRVMRDQEQGNIGEGFIAKLIMMVRERES